VTKGQAALLTFFAGMLPALLGLAIPAGGVVHKSVALDYQSIFLATVPWTLAIAAAAVIGTVLRNSKAAPWLACGAVVGSGLIAPSLAPQFNLAASKATGPLYAGLSQVGSSVHVSDGVIYRGAALAASHPQVSLGIALAGLALLTLFAYALLYGWALWAAGIVCGLFIAHLILEARGNPWTAPSTRPARSDVSAAPAPGPVPSHTSPAGPAPPPWSSTNN
jgi:hypothetical protein